MADWYSIQDPATRDHGTKLFCGPPVLESNVRLKGSRLYHDTHSKLSLKVKSQFEQNYVGIEWTEIKRKTRHSNMVDCSERRRNKRDNCKAPILEVSAKPYFYSTDEGAGPDSRSMPATSSIREILEGPPGSPDSCPNNFSPGKILMDDDDSVFFNEPKCPPRVQVRVLIPCAPLAKAEPSSKDASENDDDASFLFLGTPRPINAPQKIEIDKQEKKRTSNITDSVISAKAKHAWKPPSSVDVKPLPQTNANFCSRSKEVKPKVSRNRRQRKSCIISEKMKRKKAILSDHSQRTYAERREQALARRNLTTRVRSRSKVASKGVAGASIKMVRDMGGRSTDSSNPSSSIVSVDGRETKSRLPSVDTATTSCQSSTTSGDPEISDISLPTSARSASSSGQTDKESQKSRPNSPQLPEFTATQEKNVSIFLKAPSEYSLCSAKPTVFDDPKQSAYSQQDATLKCITTAVSPVLEVQYEKNMKSEMSKCNSNSKIEPVKDLTNARPEIAPSLVESQSSPLLRNNFEISVKPVHSLEVEESAVNIVAFFGPSAAASGYATAIKLLKEQPSLASIPCKSQISSMNGLLPLHFAIMLYRGFRPQSAAAKILKKNQLPKESKPWNCSETSTHAAALLVRALLEAYPEAAGVRFCATSSSDLKLPLFVALDRYWDYDVIKKIVDAYPDALTELHPLDAKEAQRHEPRLRRRTWARKIAISAGCSQEIVSLLPKPRKNSKGGVLWSKA